MAKRFIILLILLIAICYATKVFSQEIRLNLDDIKDLLRRGVSSEMILELIKEQGVNFKATERDLLDLRSIGADETVSSAVMEASKEWIILTIETEPTDAVIYIDGERKGKTPFALEGPKSREYNIKIEKEGYIPIEWRVSPVDTEKRKILLSEATPISTLRPEAAKTLSIETEPSDAVIYVDGKRQGRTPLTLKGLKVGEYIIKIEKEGYIPVERKISLVDTDKTKIYLQKAPPVSIWHPIIEFEYNYSERQISTGDNIETLEKDQIGVSKLNYWVNNRFDLFLDIGYAKTALSESGKFGDVNLLYGGGLKWVMFSSSSLDLDLKGEFLSFNDKQNGNGGLSREIERAEYQAAATMTSKSLMYIRPYISVFFSKMNNKVSYTINGFDSVYDFEESDPYGITVGTKIGAKRFFLFGEISFTDFNNSTGSSGNTESTSGYSIGAEFSF